MKGGQKKGRHLSFEKNTRSSEVTPTEDACDYFARLTSAVGTSTIEKQQTRQDEKKEDKKLELEVHDWAENADSDDSGKYDKIVAA